MDGSNVQPILKLTQAVGIGVDHGDVVVFTGQVFRQAGAHLTCSQQNDFHAVSLTLVTLKVSAVARHGYRVGSPGVAVIPSMEARLRPSWPQTPPAEPTRHPWLDLRKRQQYALKNLFSNSSFGIGTTQEADACGAGQSCKSQPGL